MSKDKKLIPELRFPEFLNEREWIFEPFDKVYSFLVTNSFSRENLNYNNGSVKNIHYGDIHTKFPTLFDITKEVVPFINSDISIERIREECYCKEGDLIFADASEDLNDVGKSIEIINLNSEELLSGLHTLLARQKESKLAFGFAGYLFKTDWIRKQIQREAQGAKVLGLSATRISNVKISYPKNPQEQQKIAFCLISLDEAIAAHSLKLDLLKDHRKGLMQNIFPQEGEKIPKLRFKEFEKDGSWIQTTVEDNCLVKGRIGYRGYTTQDLVGQGEGALVLGGKHIQNQMLELKDPTYLSWEKYYESPEIMVEVGDIIFSQRGTLGDCAIIDREIGPATINPSMVLLKTITCNASFLYYILIGDRIQIEVQKNRAMGAIPMLSQKQIKEFPFLIPKNPKEQQKIASFLSSLDALVAAQVEKIEQFKIHKKGLMQSLFPKIID